MLAPPRRKDPRWVGVLLGGLTLIEPSRTAHFDGALPFAGESIDAVVLSHVHPDHCADLSLLLRARYLVDARGYNRVTGLPFTSRELEQAIIEQIEDVTKGD